VNAKPGSKSAVAPRLAKALAPPELPRDRLVDEAVLSGLEISGMDLRDLSVHLADIDGCRLAGVAFTGSRLSRLTVTDTVLQRCDLANVDLSQNAMTRVDLSGSRLTGFAAPGAVWRHVRVTDCLADLSAFRFASFTRVEFADCRLQGADFVGADLSGAVFRNCDLTKAELSQVKAKGATFVDCTWDGIRGIASLAGSTIVTRSPIDALYFASALASALGITLADTE
jgi:uncharacterized protein YjbI with pentapeptide repeats